MNQKIIPIGIEKIPGFDAVIGNGEYTFCGAQTAIPLRNSMGIKIHTIDTKNELK